MLGGQPVFLLPLGAINASHASRARRVLARFDAVTLIDAHGTDPNDVLVPALGFGLPPQGARVTVASTACAFDDADRRRFTEDNAEDLWLYEQVRTSRKSAELVTESTWSKPSTV